MSKKSENPFIVGEITRRPCAYCGKPIRPRYETVMLPEGHPALQVPKVYPIVTQSKIVGDEHVHVTERRKVLAFNGRVKHNVFLRGDGLMFYRAWVGNYSGYAFSAEDKQPVLCSTTCAVAFARDCYNAGFRMVNKK